MLGSLLEENLHKLTPSTITDIFLWITVAVFGFSIWFARKGEHSQFLEYAPTLMTSLGILGTFFGVVIGLVHFDTAAIDQSIPALLGGLKTAFLTSVAGMSAAMVFNFLDVWQFAPKRARNGAIRPEITPTHIHAALETQNEQLREVLRSLGGESDGSLIGQIKLLRGDFGDFNKDLRVHNAEFNQRLWQELERFAEMLSKSATSQIIEALRQVIVDFNEKLTEQFGENFKRLDESVQKLVVWQTQYKDQVDTMSEQYRQSVDSLVETRQSVAGIWEECKEIPNTMDKLRTVLAINQHQIQELQRHLQTFVQMRDAAVQAVPTLQKKLEEIGAQMESGATNLQAKLAETGQKLLESSNKMQVALTEGADTFRDSVLQTQESVRTTHDKTKEMLLMMQSSVDELGSQMQKHSAELTNQHRQVVSELARTAELVVQQLGQSGTQTQRDLADAMERMVGELSATLSRSSAELDAHFNDSLKGLNADVNAKLKLFEEGTMREMERELETVGSALTSITKRFVKDYEGLVGRMDEVVRNQPGRGQ